MHDAPRDEVLCPGVEGPNLAAAALAAFRDATGWDGPGQRVEIVKRIPVAAGLAGGSADAAAVLRLCSRRSGLGDPDALRADRDRPGLRRARARRAADRARPRRRRAGRADRARPVRRPRRPLARTPVDRGGVRAGRPPREHAPRARRARPARAVRRQRPPGRGDRARAVDRPGARRRPRGRGGARAGVRLRANGDRPVRVCARRPARAGAPAGAAPAKPSPRCRTRIKRQSPDS